MKRMEFGIVLRMMRKSAGMTQEDMAEEMHVSRSTVAKLETDRVELKAVDLINWCRITNNPDVLMALYAGTDVATAIMSSGAATLITGTISFLLGVIL